MISDANKAVNDLASIVPPHAGAGKSISNPGLDVC